MECFALFKTAEFLKKKAACLLTVVDANYTKKALTSKEREQDLEEMIEIALESVVSIDKIADELAEIEEEILRKTKEMEDSFKPKKYKRIVNKGRSRTIRQIANRRNCRRKRRKNCN